MDLEFRELLMILIVGLICCVFVWFERGRDPAIATVAAIMLGGFAVLGAFAVVIT